MQAKYSHSQNILLRNPRYFWIYCEFLSEYQVQLTPQFHNFSFLHSTQSRTESDRNSRWPNSNSSLPNLIYPFKNLTNDTRIWVWPPWISVWFCPGLGGVEERRNCEIVESVGPDIHSEIHSISKNTVDFGAECSANGCIWLAHSTSTVF